MRAVQKQFTLIYPGMPCACLIPVRRVARSSYNPINRRDPNDQKNLQKWVLQQLRLEKRQLAGGISSTVAKKQAYLRSLGLYDKAEALGKSLEAPAWHLPHMVPGDVFEGNFEHPRLKAAQSLDLSLTVTTPEEGVLESRRGDFQKTVYLSQDFPIPHDPGPEKDEAMVRWIFHKYNPVWRSFDETPPQDEDMQHIPFRMLQLFFQQATEVEGFPSQQEFNDNCADPEKGMTRAEFLSYLNNDDAEYLGKTFPTVYTGRRLQIYDQNLFFDGDFQVPRSETAGENLILGFVSFDDVGGGTFKLELTKSG
eukprot:TRINITY_DN15773_c0_g1_i1.p1 TRINITY_DN15773_c0_g1~~TRINITY_DN15773_c0_g1_i1.p1  ORF type:complete len:309 (+),score=60.37 TRINITY_DN15773_c0_g1_i1:42-968(+)